MDDLIVWLSQAWDNIITLPGMVGGLVAAILAGIFLTLLYKLAKYCGKYFWKGLAILGCLRGFRWFAIKAYLNTIQKRFGSVHNIYLDREDELDLEKIFVPLTLHQREKQSPSANQKLTTREILTNSDHARLMILGDPGSGKSTLLKALATGISRHQWVELYQMIPVFISLRAFSQQSEPLLPWLCQTVLLDSGLRNAESLLKKLMLEGRILLLLDGLD
ncbi:MAG: hypothetical protein ACI8WB_006089, partial [Phenylobacterium sp.]